MLSYGAYGCVYHPSTDGDEKTVSKVVNQEYSLKEIEISKRIKQIPNYQEYFVPIESWFPIQSVKVKKCKALYSEAKFMVLNMPYLISVPSKFTKETFNKLTYSLELLIKHELVHFDVKEGNILFTPKPFLIDYGISIDMKSLERDTYSKSFFIYEPNNYIWPIEVHLLCYKMEELAWTKESIAKICQEVANASPVLPSTYAKEAADFYFYLTEIPSIQGIESLIKHWKTWDLYALTIILLKNGTGPLENIHYDPSKRLTPAASRL